MTQYHQNKWREEKKKNHCKFVILSGYRSSASYLRGTYFRFSSPTFNSRRKACG